MEQTKEYFAFISYKSEDVEWAIWLQHELEHYHLPASFNGRTDITLRVRNSNKQKCQEQHEDDKSHPIHDSCNTFSFFFSHYLSRQQRKWFVFSDAAKIDDWCYRHVTKWL